MVNKESLGITEEYLMIKKETIIGNMKNINDSSPVIVLS